jgi:hypothetical protein
MQLHDERAHGFRANPGIIPALVVIAVGVIPNIVYVHELWHYRPVVLIAAGLARLVDAQSDGAFLRRCAAGCRRTVSPTRSASCTSAGRLLAAHSHRCGPVDVRNRLYTRSPRRRRRPARGLAHLVAIFGGVERRTTGDFQGGNITAMFGGVNVNLRKAGMAAESAIIDISTMFGGVEIKVPENWIVVLQGTSIFGGFSDETAHPPLDVPGVKRLFLKGSAIFGGVEVKN